MRSISPLAIIDNIGRAQTAWAVVGGLLMSALSFLWDFPFPMILFIGLGSIAFLLIIIHRSNLWLSQRQVTKPERFEELGEALNKLRVAALAMPVQDIRHTPKGSMQHLTICMERYADAFQESRIVMSFIEYEHDTWCLANDYRHLCSMIFYDSQRGDDSSQNHSDLTVMHAATMSFLSNGKRVNLSQIKKPDWMTPYG